MNKILIPTGYMGSGSSAITDIFSSFEGYVAPNGSFEYVFLHCPNGVFDLEDKLLWNNNAIRSDEALRTFRAAMKELFDTPFWWPGNYKKRLSPCFMKYIDRFIEEISDFSIDSYWYHQERRGYKALPRLLMNKVLEILPYKGPIRQPLRYAGMNIAFPEAEDFYCAARKLLQSLYDDLGIGKTGLVLDQLVLPFNAQRFENYFASNTEVVVVDRDPRDVFLSNKYIWPRQNGSIPYPTDVRKFCAYYRRLRTHGDAFENSHIHNVSFEDCIYFHEATIERLGRIAESSLNESHKKTNAFDPDASINNTQLFMIPEFKKEADIIAVELPEFLYDFPETFIPNLEHVF